MMMNTTLAQLRDLKLAGMVAAIEEQLSAGASSALCFEERVALMVDREVHHRSDKRRAGLLKRAQLKYPQACIEDVDGRAGRGFERPALMSLALSRWVDDGTAVLITGPAGSGKSWLACALAQYAWPAWPLGAVPACPAPGRGVAHPARQRRLRTLAGNPGPHRRADPRRLGAGNA